MDKRTRTWLFGLISAYAALSIAAERRIKLIFIKEYK